MRRSATGLWSCVLVLGACDAGAPAASKAESKPGTNVQHRNEPMAAARVVGKSDAEATCLQPTSPPSPAELASIHGPLRLPRPARDSLEPLTSCDLYRLGASEPSYLGRLDEGNVAPYGILLAADPSPALAERLLSQEKAGQWEYSAGYGPTSADTAMVVEGLLAAKVDRRRLTQSLRSLARDYFDAKTGGFRTVLNGRAGYWQGVSTETTAHVAYLMQRVDPAAFAREIEQARNFVVKHQGNDGRWEGRWFPSEILPTFHSVRLLSALGSHEVALERAAHFVLSLQRSDGSFAGRVIETSLAVLALTATGGQQQAVERGRSWLRSRSAGETCTAGEPFLYYWFEPDERTRLFFTCVDRGPIARAWARLALAP
jgi:hypothetical protein